MRSEIESLGKMEPAIKGRLDYQDLDLTKPKDSGRDRWGFGKC